MTEIGRRVSKALVEYKQKDYESTLLQISPAIDSTAKRRFPKLRVGDRIKRFVNAQDEIVTYVGCGSVITSASIFERTLGDQFYEFGRCSIVHDGTVDPRLHFMEGQTLLLGAGGSDMWILPADFLFGLIIAVVVAPENKEEKANFDAELTIRNEKFDLSTLWGNRNALENAFPILRSGQ